MDFRAKTEKICHEESRFQGLELLLRLFFSLVKDTWTRVSSDAAMMFHAERKTVFMVAPGFIKFLVVFELRNPRISQLLF